MEQFRLLNVLESLQTNGRVDVHRPLLIWIIRKFRSVLSTAEVTQFPCSTWFIMDLDFYFWLFYSCFFFFRVEMKARQQRWIVNRRKDRGKRRRRRLPCASARPKWPQLAAPPFLPRCRLSRRVSSKNTPSSSKKQVNFGFLSLFHPTSLTLTYRLLDGLQRLKVFRARQTSPPTSADRRWTYRKSPALSKASPCVWAPTTRPFRHPRTSGIVFLVGDDRRG